MRSVRAWVAAGMVAAGVAAAQPARDGCACGQGRGGAVQGSKGRMGTGGSPVALGSEPCCGCNCTKDGAPSDTCACACIQDGRALPPCKAAAPGQGGSGLGRNVPDKVPDTVPQAPEDRGGSAVTPGSPR
jgi:hypothetical protein